MKEMMRHMRKLIWMLQFILFFLLFLLESDSAAQSFRKREERQQWHHGAFHDVGDTVRSDIRRMLHSRAEVPFQVPLEVNIVLIGLNGDGGYRYMLDSHKLEDFLRTSFPSHRPSCLETGEELDIEHHIVYNTIPVGQRELIEMEKALRDALVPAGTSKGGYFGKDVPLFEVEATVVEPMFQKLYSHIFDVDGAQDSAGGMGRPIPVAVFIVNIDKVRIDPREKSVDFDKLMYTKIGKLTEEELKKQDGGFIYHYRYDGGGASQVWLGSGRFLVIDISAGPCTYGKIETEEGTVSMRSLPRLHDLLFLSSGASVSHSTDNIFLGQLSALISSAVEHVIVPDVRFETVDSMSRLLVPIIALQNHNRYSVIGKGNNYSLDIESIASEVKKMVHHGQEVVVINAVHPLHRHEKLAIAVSKAIRGHSVHHTKNDGHFHVHTKTYLDGAILREEFERSADVLAAGLIEMADPSLSAKFFFRQEWAEELDALGDSLLHHKSISDTYMDRVYKQKNPRKKKGQGNWLRTFGTRVIPVFVLSLADVDPLLLMEDESLVWASSDVVIVLEHQNDKIPLSYVSETQRRYALPSQPQRHLLAGLASAIGGLTPPYEKASHVHGRQVFNWLWASGCHPFGPFSNSTQISQLFHDISLRNNIYARVDAALRNVRDMSEHVQSFVGEYLRTPLGEPVKGKKNKTRSELWLEKFYKKTTKLPEPFPHEMVESLENYLDALEERLVELSSLLYDHQLEEAHFNSSEILQSSIFTKQFIYQYLDDEKEKMKCCAIEYRHPVQSSQTMVYGGILLAGFITYFIVIFFSPPVR